MTIGSPSAAGPRELVVIARSGADLRPAVELSAMPPTPESLDLQSTLDTLGAALVPMFDAASEVAAQAAAGDLPSAGQFFTVAAPDEQLEEVAARLRALPSVEAAYVKAPAEPAEILNDMEATAMADLAAPTPDFRTRQGYLDKAPAGVDAAAAWAYPGGRGSDVRVIDVEGAWRFTHEDNTANIMGVVGGTASSDLGWRNHGTAVIGEIGGDDNSIGVVGIAPESSVGAVSIFPSGSAHAFAAAAARLRAGDILLVELHRPGPNATGVGQQGYIAMEWWPDDYFALQAAVARGIIVVAAAGNGAENLDAPVYDTALAGFPAWWRNPFRRAPLDSGAILVGAGAPPPGTHGQDHGPDRSRLGFSNFGAAVDAQGWGREVTTLGYGDLQGGPSEDRWYTDRFSGTSSASPIVVGTLAALQGIARRRGRPIVPAEARRLLRSTGSPQEDAPGRPRTQRIGNRPDLRALTAAL